nr:hypothetical protein [Chitinophagales bacterium]
TILPLYQWGFDSGKDEMQDIQWHPNSVDIYYTKWKNGLYKVNVNEKKEILIKEGCDSKAYEVISISADGTKMITERVNSYVENANTAIQTYVQNSRIYIMNIDGSDEHEIVLPLN